MDESLIIGVWSPASLKVFTEIPKDSTSSFRNITIETTSSNLLITSLTSDPSKGVVFAAIQNFIYINHLFLKGKIFLQVSQFSIEASHFHSGKLRLTMCQVICIGVTHI